MILLIDFTITDLWYYVPVEQTTSSNLNVFAGEVCAFQIQRLVVSFNVSDAPTETYSHGIST